MINPEELRLGNLIHVHNQEGVFRTVEIGKPEIYLSPADTDLSMIYKIYSTEAKPIPLSVEWLEKHCNESQFTSDPQEGNASKAYWFGNVIVHQTNENEDNFFVYLMDYGYRDREFTIKLNYVHQFQNFMYALTGNELTLKP